MQIWERKQGLRKSVCDEKVEEKKIVFFPTEHTFFFFQLRKKWLFTLISSEPVFQEKTVFSKKQFFVYTVNFWLKVVY